MPIYFIACTFSLMVISLIHPHTCGFAKVIAWQLTKVTQKETQRMKDEGQAKYRSRVMAEHHKRFLGIFSECKDNFAIDLQCFEKKFPDLQQKFVRWNSRKINERSIYITTFNVDTWKLSPSKKAEHSLMECHGCAHGNSYEQLLFPVKSKQFKSCFQDNVFFAARKSVQEVLEQPTLNRCTKHEAAKTVRELYDKINPKFQKTCNIPLAEALINVHELNLQQKK